jgi:maleate isomerase
MNMWQPDGTGVDAKIGVLTPHMDPVPESELMALAPQGVSIHAARVPLGMVGPDGKIIPIVGPDIARAFSEPPEVDHAVSLLAPLELSAIIYGFTSSSYILGVNDDLQLKARLEARSNGTPVITQSMALIQALNALNSTRISLIHPPWFTEEMDELGVKYFGCQGFDVVSHGSANLRSDYGEITPEQLHNYALNQVPDNADTLVIGGGGFRAIGAINELEKSLNRPVISANQASMWAALNIAGVDVQNSSYGRLFHLTSK